MTASTTFAAFLQDQYAKLFGRPWAVIPSALVIGSLNVFLFAFDKPWTASDGMRNWGDWLFQSLRLLSPSDLLPPWLYSGSVLNLGVLLGGLSAALLSREFGFRPAPAAELIKGALGGSLMGWGAMLAFGCNIGGFFSALSALSLSGLGMMAGLFAGGWLSTRYLIWENARLIRAGQIPFMSVCETPPQPVPGSTSFVIQPWLGGLLILALLGAGYLYRQLGHQPLAVFLFFGVALGVVFQRSRFCLVSAFREPFLSGQSEHTRAAALALTFSMIGFSILKATDLKDITEWVFPAFWFGALSGGTLFGVGMVIAGGCGAGTIWRAGEGHAKLWVALFFFAIGASMMRRVLVTTELIGQLGFPWFLPNLIGWTSAIWVVVALMALWYVLSGWNESRKSVGLLKF
ncbi:MAG TPA: YeeE/YedE thiosulfate transporter family protein [Candidatus Binatia bacterium]|nr:YeeE/YedE thiosulfate transporter family protein [Candidatus Binatia bacterium]